MPCMLGGRQLSKELLFGVCQLPFIKVSSSSVVFVFRNWNLWRCFTCDKFDSVSTGSQTDVRSLHAGGSQGAICHGSWHAAYAVRRQ